MRDRKQLISTLVDDLSVKPRQLPILITALLWWLLSWAYVALTTLMMGPFRPSAYYDITHSQHFQVESLIGLLAGLLMAVVAWYGSVPGALSRRMLMGAYLLAIIWIGFYVAGFLNPSLSALEPSMLGKREYCYLEAFVSTFPPTLIGCFYVAKRFPLKTLQTGMLMGLAAGMMPALIMQFACMYEAEHTLTHHILPGIINGGVGVLVLLTVNAVYLNSQP